MSAFADLVLADGQASPVSRTFKAVAEVDGYWTWSYIPSGGLPLSAVTVRSRTTFPKDPNGVTRHEVQIKLPFVETPANEAPRVAYYEEVSLTVKTSGRSLLQERKDILAYVKNFLAHTRASELVVDGDPPR